MKRASELGQTTWSSKLLLGGSFQHVNLRYANNQRLKIERDNPAFSLWSKKVIDQMPFLEDRRLEQSGFINCHNISVTSKYANNHI